MVQSDCLQCNLNLSDHYFCIDSNNLDVVKNHLYGYAFYQGCIIEHDHMSGFSLDEIHGGLYGAYVCVSVENDEVVLYQDYLGAFGIYLYRDGDYIAISNSLNYLADYVKETHPLNINREYCYAFAALDQGPFSFSETIFREIEWLPRNVEVHINIKSRTLYLNKIDFSEKTVPLQSEEAFAILDSWIDRWRSFFCSLEKQNVRIIADLTGGFDSRLSFLPLLVSGIDLNQVNVNSAKSNVKGYTFDEDYLIAEEISKKFNFSLNNNAECASIPFSADEMLNSSFFPKLGCNKLLYPAYGKRIKRAVHINGIAGEVIYDEWDEPFRRFIINKCKECFKIPIGGKTRAYRAVVRTISKSGREMMDWFGIKGFNNNSSSRHIYTETRVRLHCGRSMVEEYTKNIISLNPILDPELQKINFNIPEVDTPFLLPLVIYERYCSELLSVRFRKGKGYKEDAVSFAKNLSAEYVYKMKKTSIKDVVNPLSYEASNFGGKMFRRSEFDEIISKIFFSQTIKQTIESGMGKAFYEALCADVSDRLQGNIHNSLRSAIVGIGIAKAYNDELISKGKSQEALQWLDIADTEQYDCSKDIKRIRTKNILYYIYRSIRK